MSMTYLERCYQVQTPNVKHGGFGLFENTPAFSKEAAAVQKAKMIENGTPEDEIIIVDITDQPEALGVENSPFRFVFLADGTTAIITVVDPTEFMVVRHFNKLASSTRT